MTIVPAAESTYRLKIRRGLTLDLFTRYGAFWDAIAKIRYAWEIMPDTAVPPEPDFHTELVGLMTRYQMPERFHMPTSTVILPTGEADLQIDRRLNVYAFLKELSDVWKAEIASPREREGDWRNGGNVIGWMSWTPFLSASVLYDPPTDNLLEFAAHDDHIAASLSLRTFSQDGDVREEAAFHKVAFLAGDFAAARLYGETLRESFFESNSMALSNGAGNPSRMSNSLRDVQCAVMSLDGMSPTQIGERLGIEEYAYPDSYNVKRSRPNAVEKAVRRGMKILNDRNFSRPKY